MYPIYQHLLPTKELGRRLPFKECLYSPERDLVIEVRQLDTVGYLVTVVAAL